jgi:glycosyltransferase involved in cell wall biosynthesis
VALIAVLRWQKGHRDLIDAFAALDRDKYADTDLLLVGAGPQEPALREKLRELSLGNRVRLLGHQSPIEPWFHASDMFVMPSYAEGIPQALMQAMACGLPSIVTAIPSLLETVTPDEDALMLDTPGDVAALKGLMERLLDQPRLRARLGSAAHRNAERFSQTHMLVAMEKVFARAARQRARRLIADGSVRGAVCTSQVPFSAVLPWNDQGADLEEASVTQFRKAGQRWNAKKPSQPAKTRCHTPQRDEGFGT